MTKIVYEKKRGFYKGDQKWSVERDVKRIIVAAKESNPNLY